MITPTELIPTRAEAMQRAKVTNVWSWVRWCKQWGCRSQSSSYISIIQSNKKPAG